MSITTLSGPKRNRDRGAPVIMRLRKGDEKTDPKRPGPDLDYFRVTAEPGYEHLLPAFTELYGAKPRYICGVLLAGTDDASAFPNWMEEWSASGLTRRCDGATQVLRFGDRGYDQAPAPCASGACGCKPTGRLMFYLPEFTRKTGVFGQFMMVTHGILDIESIAQYLQTVSSIQGTLTGVPFELERVLTKLKYVKKDRSGQPTGERGTSEKWLVHLRVMPEFVRAGLNLSAGDSAPALPSGRTIDPETGEILQPALPAGETITAADVAATFSQYGITKQDHAALLALMGLSRFGDFTGTLDQFRVIVAGYIESAPVEGDIDLDVF